jgi:glycosyltransferase involved in cell wall biosynthesis
MKSEQNRSELKVPRNILFIIDGLSGGGAERVVLTLAESMVADGDQVQIISLRNESAYALPQGVQYQLVEDCYHGPFRRWGEIKRRARLLDLAIETTLGGKKFDLVVSHLTKTDRIVAESKTLHGAWYCLHCAMTVGELSGKGALMRWRKRRQLQKIYDGKKLITVSSALQEDVRNFGIKPAKITTIYNPFDLKKIRERSKEATPFDGEQFLLHVGRFHPQKRHDRLLEAFQRCGYPGKLLLLGGGNPESKSAIQETAKHLGIENRVLFGGFVSNPYAVMRAAEALVLSSDYEGLGNVLIEALICGTQVISTNCPYGPSEILRGPLAQGLCEPTVAGLTESVRRVLGNPVPITEEMLAPFTIEESLRKYRALACLDSN